MTVFDSVRNSLYLGLATLTILALVACSAGSTFSTLSVNSERCEKNSVTFDKRHKLAVDIYLSDRNPRCLDEQTKRAAKGTVVFVYGGGWRQGDKSEYGFVADALVAEGYDVLVPNYRLYPQVGYPDFIQDLETFFAWLSQNAATYQLNLDNAHVMAHSAGSYNTLMYLADDRYAKPLVFDSFIGLAGAYDFFLPTKDPKYIPIFEKNDKAFNAKSELPVNQSATRLNQHLRRALLIHGEDDDIVTPKNLPRTKAFLEEHGVATQTRLFKDKGHIAVVARINNVPLMDSGVERAVLAFIAKE